jgi:hypothetical protein
MSGLAAGLQAPGTSVSAAGRRTDIGIRAAAGVTVAALAGIAGAISYSHMRELAAAHGETGWQAHTFPLSVDGIEIVASLVLLADRRTGRRSGWLPWAALAAGTTASLAANVAAAGADLVGRVVAGWPAFALLVAIKLLAQLLEPRRDGDRPVKADDRPITPPGRPPVPGAAGDDLPTVAAPAITVAGGHRDASPPDGTRAFSRPINGHGPLGHPGTAHAADPEPGRGEGPGMITQATPGTGTPAQAGTRTTDIADLLPAARAARDRLRDRGDALTRDSLAAELRRDGYPARNAKISRLLTTLKHEAGHLQPAQR